MRIEQPSTGTWSAKTGGNPVLLYRYAFDGSVTRFGRRDMRRGGAMGRAEPTPTGMVCVSRWDEPLPGWGKEHFHMPSAGELHVESHMNMNGRIVRYRTIYHRR